MQLQFFNTLSGKKEFFVPLSSKGIVKIYCCGVTPYSNTHIGHGRTFFSYDLLYRTLVDHGFEVKWARNITDVDDKIINKANAENVSCQEIVDRYITEQTDLLRQFFLLRPEYEPKVTESIDQIIVLVQELIQKNYAYVSATGVYFRVRHFESYGKLSGNKIDDLKKGVRIDVDESKEDPLDFGLWKFAKPGEIYWPSPWGNGRPGWHVECSAMIHKVFGNSIDIHMGGRDLIFPHHECEIAQSEAFTNEPLSQFWLHAGMVTLNGEKMSKSSQHFVTLKDFLTKYPAEVLRLIFLSAAYTSAIDFSHDLCVQNLKKLAKIYRFVALVDEYSEANNVTSQHFDLDVFGQLKGLVQKMRDAIADDLNTSAALAILFDFMRNVNTQLLLMEKKNKCLHGEDIRALKTHWPEFKKWIKQALGLLNHSAQEFFNCLSSLQLHGEVSIEQINLKIRERDIARGNKDWKAADGIRDELLNQGIHIQDTLQGTRWAVAISNNE